MYTERDLADLVSRADAEARHASTQRQKAEMLTFLAIVRFLDYDRPSWRAEIVDQLNKAGVDYRINDSLEFDIPTLSLDFEHLRLDIRPLFDKEVDLPESWFEIIK